MITSLGSGEKKPQASEQGQGGSDPVSDMILGAPGRAAGWLCGMWRLVWKGDRAPPVSLSPEGRTGQTILAWPHAGAGAQQHLGILGLLLFVSPPKRMSQLKHT